MKKELIQVVEQPVMLSRFNPCSNGMKKERIV